MITIKNIAIKNFMSVGNVTQSINFVDKSLVLVLGENLDMGGNDSRNGVGKAQPLYSKIKIPTGWTTMGTINVGDIVSVPSGEVATVSHVFPQGKKKTYKIHFSDGRTVDSCEDHLWKTYSHSFCSKSDDKFLTLTTNELIEHTNKYKNYKNKSSYYKYVPLIKTGISTEAKLPLDPYFIGAMLGDGSFSKSGLNFSSADIEIYQNLQSCLPKNTELNKNPNRTYGYSFKQIKRQKLSYLVKSLDELKLYGTLSHTKFIPEIYKQGSTDQKIELLRGLVDTDGYVGKQGCLSICTVSQQLAKDIQEMVWSIGGIAHINKKINCGYKKNGVFVPCKDAYNISIMYHTPKDLSKLTRKIDRLPGKNYQYKNRKLRIENIEYIGEIESQCIMIDHSDHLYITDNYVVTHNSTIVNALSYAFYGSALTNIRKDNLVNKTNAKNMVVTLEFEKNGVEYLIERGRRPNKFAFMVAGMETDADDADEAQGDSRVTQQQLERELGISHTMFKNIVALNTYSEPFLSMKAADQREIIEQLLGITKLSEKAEVLKEKLKNTKDSVREEELKIDATKAANKRIEDNIKKLHAKSAAWDISQEKLITDTQSAISVLEGIDIEEEIENHKLLVDIKDVRTKHAAVSATCKSHSRAVKGLELTLATAEERLVVVDGQTCHTCGQDLLGDAHEKLMGELVEKITETETSLVDKRGKLTASETERDVLVLVPAPDTFYDDMEGAYDHRSSLESLQTTLEAEVERENHFIEQIASLEDSGIQNINYSKMNDLIVLRDHQDFLLKLLTSKDSFIRKKIINQNLAYLNSRLEHYIERMGLPHRVKFLADLNVEIREHGRDLDFDNLSRGERTRLILSLSFSFRDVYESLNTPISLLFIDELIDSGLDAAGVESSLAVLKKMARESQRNVFLISHRDELVGRVGSVMKVIKEGGFTSFEYEVELE